jgi:hypothetical protein
VNRPDPAVTKILENRSSMPPFGKLCLVEEAFTEGFSPSLRTDFFNTSETKLLFAAEARTVVTRGGSVRLNSFRTLRKWISRSIMLRPGLVVAV